MSSPTFIASRNNPLIVRLRKLAKDSAAYRHDSQVWIEGEHLCSAWQARCGQATQALQAVITEAAWNDDSTLRNLAASAEQTAVVPAALFEKLSALGSPARIGFVVAMPASSGLDPLAATVVLDRLQDAGNVGSILRSAAAFGTQQVLAIKGTAALWSPKVLRAAMGAHFGLRLIEGLAPGDLDALQVPMLATSSHAGQDVSTAELPTPCAWVLGHEGQGVSEALLQRCRLQLRIPQPGGEESLNVAAAAAVCLYEGASRSMRTARDTAR